MGKAASMESFHWKHTLQEQRIKALEKKSKRQIRDHLVGQLTNLQPAPMQCDGIGQGITLQYIGAYNGSLASNLRS